MSDKIILLVTGRREVFEQYLVMYDLHGDGVKHVTKHEDLIGFVGTTRVRFLWGYTDLDGDLITDIMERFNWERDYALG